MISFNQLLLILVQEYVPLQRWNRIVREVCRIYFSKFDSLFKIRVLYLSLELVHNSGVLIAW